MNLLSDSFLPVLDHQQLRTVGLQDILCGDEDFQIAFPRDDMELSALQLLICLTQSLLMPADDAAHRHRLRHPLSVEEYQQAVANYLDWFELDHPTMPFMQTRGVKSAEATPIQKLFIGLPEGNNHAFFNDEGEVRAVCGGCAAIALFHQASNCPSFGGGFKGSLRGSAPVTTLIDAATLRRRIWENVLPRRFIAESLPWLEEPAAVQAPVWVEPIRAGQTIHIHQIGLTRGLLWQPTHVELVAGESGHCDHCGVLSEARIVGFKKEKFNYTLEGLWPHPHSPRVWNIKSGERDRDRYVSFTTTAPAWTHLSQFLIAQTSKKEGSSPASVVLNRKRRRQREPLRLLVGGYRNNQANVIERRHELFSLRPGWEAGDEELRTLVDMGLQVKKALRGSLYWASNGQKDHFKGIGVPIHEAAEAYFYARSEPLVLSHLRELDFSAAEESRDHFLRALEKLARELFEQAVYPYQHDAELVHAIAAARAKFRKDLRTLKETYHVTTA